MSYQRVIRQPAGKRGRRLMDDDEAEGQWRGRRGGSRRLGAAWDEDSIEWDVNEWAGVLYTARIRNGSRAR